MIIFRYLDSVNDFLIIGFLNLGLNPLKSIQITLLLFFFVFQMIKITSFIVLSFIFSKNHAFFLIHLIIQMIFVNFWLI